MIAERAEIIRIYLPTETLSTVNAIAKDGTIVYTCKGMELPKLYNGQENVVNKTCIREGVYACVKESPDEPTELNPHPHFPYGHFRLADQAWKDRTKGPHSSVPGRIGICWHRITYVKDLLGCLGIGGGFVDLNGDQVPDMVNSSKALQELYDVMPDYFLATYKERVKT